MPTAISVRFLTGRAHLHPWDTHHSEGRVEWPPSPWRLLRSIVAVAGRGLTTLPLWDDLTAPRTGRGERAGRGEPPPRPMQDVVGDAISLSRLADLLLSLVTAPEIWLPKTSGGHTRQFFPVHEAGVTRSTGSAVFDTFAAVDPRKPVVFHWPSASLSSELQQDLRLILSRLTYFGRAESWCDAACSQEITDRVHPGRTHWRCICIEDVKPGEQGPEGREYRDYTLERLLGACPLQGGDGSDTLKGEAIRVFTEIKQSAATSAKKKQEQQSWELQIGSESDATLLLRCLLRESGQDMADGLDRPIGTRWVHYSVPRDIYDLPAPRPKRIEGPREAVDLVRFALNTATASRPVLPPLTDTLLVADKFRSAALAIHELTRDKRAHPRSLCGREANGELCQGHTHAFFWPADEDADGFIDHVTVYARAGLEQGEVDALRRLLRIRQRGSRPDLLLTPLYVGSEAGFAPWAAVAGRLAHSFVSATPYYSPIHLSHGNSSGGRRRPLRPQIIAGLMGQRLVGSEDDIEAIEELAFDYDPSELAETQRALSAGTVSEPLPPRQYFPVIEPPTAYPPLPTPHQTRDVRYLNAIVKDPDAGYPFGLSLGLWVGQGTRFIRALSFCRRRRGVEVRSHGRMLRITFRTARSPRPFAIGSQCHFGLGLFVPERSEGPPSVTE